MKYRYSFLKKYLRYDVNGILYWRVAPCRNVAKGDVAGSTYKYRRYNDVTFLGIPYKKHIVVWCLHNKKDAIGFFIDHIDRDTTNNRPDNLRSASRAENARNAKRRSDNTSGIKGLYIFTKKLKTKVDQKYYIAQIRHKPHVSKKYFPFTSTGKRDATKWLKQTRKLVHGEYAREK